MNPIDIISKVSPVLGAALGGPMGGLVGSLISKVLGVDMKNPEELSKKMEDPECASKLKELELELSELQNARDAAARETGFMRYMRPMLVILAFVSLFLDFILLIYVENEMIKQALLVFTGVLILDIRQIYKMYFGSFDEKTSFMGNIFKKK